MTVGIFKTSSFALAVFLHSSGANLEEIEINGDVPTYHFSNVLPGLVDVYKSSRNYLSGMTTRLLNQKGEAGRAG